MISAQTRGSSPLFAVYGSDQEDDAAAQWLRLWRADGDALCLDSHKVFVRQPGQQPKNVRQAKETSETQPGQNACARQWEKCAL